MSEDADHDLTPALDSLSYGVPNRAGPENSLQGDDHDYFLNSGDLAGIPVVGSDNEDDQNFTPKDTLSSAIHDEDHLEEGREFQITNWTVKKKFRFRMQSRRISLPPLSRALYLNLFEKILA